ncbi:MAG: outer membrane lipoprotein-sorting protein, partial [Gammaproteobacteria bacterium]
VSGRGPDEDSHELIDTSDAHYVLRHVPKDDSTVEFASYVTWIDRQTLLPVKIEYQDARGDVYRRVEVLEVEDVQGYPTVSKSRVSNLKSGGHTDMQIRFVAYDLDMPEDVFTERSMRNPPKQWLQRPPTAR